MTPRRSGNRCRSLHTRGRRYSGRPAGTLSGVRRDSRQSSLETLRRGRRGDAPSIRCRPRLPESQPDPTSAPQRRCGGCRQPRDGPWLRIRGWSRARCFRGHRQHGDGGLALDEDSLRACLATARTSLSRAAGASPYDESARRPEEYSRISPDHHRPHV